MKDILLTICPNANIFEVPVEGRQGPVHAIGLVFDKIKNYYNEETIISYCDYGTVWNYRVFMIIN